MAKKLKKWREGENREVCEGSGVKRGWGGFFLLFLEGGVWVKRDGPRENLRSQ